MVSNQILQSTVDGLTQITHVEMCVTDTDGRAVVSTMREKRGYERDVLGFVKSPAESQEIQGSQFFKIYDEQQLEYILIVSGANESAFLVGKMAAFQISGLLVAYKERFDKDNFIKNLLLDNLLLVDIYSRAKKLRLQIDLHRIVLIVETTAGKDSNTLEIVKEQIGAISGAGNRAIVTAVDEKDVVIVKDLPDEQSESDVPGYAAALSAALTKAGLSGVKIAYGTVVSEIKDVSRSYKEAKMALDVGKIFFTTKDIIPYNELGIGRLIYQLPLPLCKMFIQEIFEGRGPEEFDEETLMTIHKFFENSLNVSETSRQLFIHRNTLVYRLDKLQKSTNLDLRVFEDAITFKIALMVVDYMKYMESKSY